MNVSDRYVRYGLSNPLWRVLTVTPDDNVSCTGKALHRVRAVRVQDGERGMWWVTDEELPRYA